MALTDIKFNLDLNPGFAPPIIHVSEYDINRQIIINITENGKQFQIPSGTTATIEGTLNNQGFEVSGNINNNSVVFPLTESMTASSGRAWTKVKFRQNNKPLSTCAFILDVDRAGVQINTVINSQGFSYEIDNAVDNWLNENGAGVTPEQIDTAIENYFLLHPITKDILPISPDQYGAKADGITDDTAAIQRCIDENPNSTITFDNGIYCISNTIDLWGASGGQMIILGGATIKWIGEASKTTPMLRVSKDYTPTVSSFCRIIGGNLDGDNKVGIGVQNLAFYTDISYIKILNFTAYGILNGPTDYAITKSTQAKFHDLHIFQRNGDFSAEDTCAIGLSYPDNQISNVVTNRTGTAYRLFSGGNSFTNCHSTIEYRDASSLTTSTFESKHIELMPEKSGTTQENVFSNMYFNGGKYVVYVVDQATNLITHIASSHYTFYRTTSLPFRGEGYLFAGHPGVFICDSFDVVVGGSFDFYDYFPETAPTESTVPRKLEINQNHRHPEASIFSANNYCTESSKPNAIANTTNPIPQSGQYYLVGAILESYTPSASIEDRYQGAVKIEWSATDNHNEAIITFDEGGAKIVYERVGAITPDHRIYVGKTAYSALIGGVEYSYYPIYVYASAGVAYRMALKAYSLDYYTKCYVRSHLTSEIQPESVDASTLLRLGAKRGVTTSRVNLGNVAFTGSYNDLVDLPPTALPPVSASDNGKFLRVVNGAWAVKSTDDIKTALLNCFQNVAWINDAGQTYYDALEAALYHPKTLVSISAAFNQGSAVVHSTDSLDTLRQYLTVTATYDDSSTGAVTNYTLSGTLAVGTSTITVSYGGKTDTFDVTVTASANVLYSLASPTVFDGTNVVNTELKLLESDNPFTILCEFENGAYVSNSILFDCRSDKVGTYGIGFYESDAAVYKFTGPSSSQPVTEYTTGLGQKLKMAIRYNAVNHVWYMDGTVDGIRKAQSTVTTKKDIVSVEKRLIIGGCSNYQTEIKNWSGTVDSFVVYDREFTDSEVNNWLGA